MKCIKKNEKHKQGITISERMDYMNEKEIYEKKK